MAEPTGTAKAFDEAVEQIVRGFPDRQVDLELVRFATQLDPKVEISLKLLFEDGTEWSENRWGSPEGPGIGEGE